VNKRKFVLNQPVQATAEDGTVLEGRIWNVVRYDERSQDWIYSVVFDSVAVQVSEQNLSARALHPVQPLITDEHGVLRFKQNAIVRFLLDNGPYDLNTLLGQMDFNEEDWQQFAQLIGYSLSGYGDLSYVTDEAYERAEKQADPTA
jgi:hypothetical protein